jgi:hypothetical protein
LAQVLKIKEKSNADSPLLSFFTVKKKGGIKEMTLGFFNSKKKGLGFCKRKIIKKM